MDTSTTKIAIIGNNYDDFIHYITRVLYHLNLRTCVIDCSCDQAQNYTLPREDDESVYSYRGIDFILNQKSPSRIKELDLTSYECCIYIFGVNVELLGYLNQFDKILMITSILKKDLNQLTSFIQGIECNHPLKVVRVLRDYVNTKMNKYYFQRELDTAQIELVEEYILYLSEDIHKYRIQSQYNDYFKFNFIDNDMKRVLKEIISYFTLANEKSIKKAYKLAERGK